MSTINNRLAAWTHAVGIVGACLIAAPLAAAVDPSSPIADALKRADAGVVKIIAVPDAQRNFDNTVGALDDVIGRLNVDSNMTLFLKNVSTDKAERDRGAQAEEDFGNWMVELGKNETLYNAIKAAAAKGDKLEGEKKRLLAFTLRDFRRSGMELPADKRDELKKLQMQLNKLGIQFDQNYADDESVVALTADELKGMPDSFMKSIKDRRSGDVYLVPMDPPSFNAILDSSPIETTRQKSWFAWKRRGGEKNVQVLENILKLRAQAAELLGYPSTAAYEIEVRMAKTAQNVQKFYDDLRPRVREKAKRDFDEYLEMKKSLTGDANTTLHPWDQSYVEKQLIKTRYAVDSAKVQEYFPYQRVVDGLFSITQSLYGLEYREITKTAGRKLWHPDVRLFEVWDKATNAKLGEFSIDLFPRDGKFKHAAQWGLADHKVYNDGTVQKPVAALVCNFTKPTDTEPSLLTHDEVETFFHEFGHCLHTILSEVHYGYFSGANVERDFVEAPSQMFENWVWDANVLNTFAQHYKTGQPLPEDMLQGMIKARYMGSGLFAEHQFYYGLVDFAYHTAPRGEVDTSKVAMDLFSKIELYPAEPLSLFQASFGHLVGYQAGYYGYQWSLVYAQDMFQRFKELGMLSPEAGMYYRKKILSRGGTLDGLDLVKDYLGREPKMDAYLEHLGLKPGSN